MRLIHGDCLEVMSSLTDSSVDLVVADPPYFKVKDRKTCGWDHQWKTEAEYLAWLGKCCEQWRRLLKANGSLYVFASPKMAAHVEVEIGRWFEVLNQVVWVKHDGNGNGMHSQQHKEGCRSWFPRTERIVFAEHFGADNVAKGKAGYESKCDELRGFVFEPLRAYLDGERKRAGVSVRQIAEAFQKKTGSRTVTGMAGHWFNLSQWELPTEENYEWLRSTLAGLNHDGEYLWREYEYLRREYEDLRRPFHVTAEVPYTDVWDFPTVQYHAGKHPCEKPAAMLRHIVQASSRNAAVVLDPFMGSGVLGVVCKELGLDYIGIESDEKWLQKAQSRIDEVNQSTTLFKDIVT